MSSLSAKITEKFFFSFHDEYAINKCIINKFLCVMGFEELVILLITDTVVYLHLYVVSIAHANIGCKSLNERNV